jgi:hemolysin activation/secretion protein
MYVKSLFQNLDISDSAPLTDGGVSGNRNVLRPQPINIYDSDSPQNWGVGGARRARRKDSCNCRWVSPTYIYVLLLILTTVGIVRSPIAFAQSINPVPQNPPPQPQPELLPPTENLLDNPSSPFNPRTPNPDIPGTRTIERFEFVGNTVFTDEELAAKTQEFADRPISFTELLQVADRITQLYLDNGYITSGAYIPAGQTIGNNVVQIKIVEGSLEATNISNSDRLEGYVRRRLALDDSEPLNINELQQALQLLRLDPLVTNISATLSPSPLPGKNILDVAVDAANPWSARVTLDNNRSPA